MALPTEVNYNLELDKIVAALNVMWNDDKVRNPVHPLRRLNKQIFIDGEGLVKKHPTYVAETYAGNTPSVGGNLDVIFKLP